MSVRPTSWSPAEVPEVRAAFEALGARGGDRRGRARREASGLRTTLVPLAEIALRLQIAASADPQRARLHAALNRRRNGAHRARRAREQRLGASKRLARAPREPFRMTTARWLFVLAFVGIATGFACVLPRMRGRSGFVVADIEVGALWAGVLTLVFGLGLALLVRHSPAVRREVGGGGLVVLAAFALLSLGTTVRRAIDADRLGEPAVVFGIAALGATVSWLALAAWFLRAPKRSAPLDARASERAAFLAEVAPEIAAATADEDADASLLRRVAYADAVHTLLKRGAIDRDDAETLVRGGAMPANIES